MKIHEYQGKELLRQFGVVVPRGFSALSVDEAVAAAEKLGGPVWVVKAQIHAGGRGKGGGVKLARSIDEVRTIASEILGMQLITHQTSPEGQKVRRLLIEEGADIKKEYYVGIVTDRTTQRVCVMASSEGGMDVEEVAEHSPEKILKVFVDPATGLTDADAATLARGIGVPEASVALAAAEFQKLYKVYWDTDASLAEINPLVLTGSGGIMRCDVIAQGVITACKAVNLSVPLVVRMKGTNEDLGKKMLAESGLPIISANTMAEAATRVVAAAK